MNYQWNWGVFLQPTAAGDDIYLGWMLSGLQMTVMLSLSAWLIALLLGAVIGVLRTVPNRFLSGLAATYVELFRNVPLLVQLFIWYFVLPELVPASLGDAYKQSHPVFQQFLAAMVCLGLFTSARVAEQVRSGINALPRGQKNAGLALGFSLPQVYRHVLLPMAFRLIVPPLTSEFLNIFKNSAVCSTIGLLELAAQGRQLVDYTAQPYESFIAVTVAYVAINIIVMTLMKKLEDKVRVPGYMGGK
ncbi:L-glutamate ABC transporter membrane protein /L-aspartate ABC transporter membrane protein [Azonexus fungiphilus]|jgi:glutamate/aspartate transport system permease protein|uniref:L-glutamate ABC transporter membrane protein /L-aspartate ABC transporter membrane protein n=1 Tax=Azonexus fungiphilus TaxID=146940 RepID=A0A495VNW8_9RHOO|nr:amino acid ABC transporter permease [Azonexus fungiphilus]NHC06673.1 amino acid ABC transporter permease [Azonexus fungiphilus]RKT51101.1 L-glutamate ABC transporter membrane protein /L-aspartate ABC transporter membrane protein [Azonexus fungiphilus]